MTDEEKQAEQEQNTRAEVEAEIFGGEPPASEEPKNESGKEPEGDNGQEPQEEGDLNNGDGVKPGDDDPWASVPTALRERFNSLEQQVAAFPELQNRLKTAEGRVSWLQSELAKKASQDVPKKDAPTKEDVAAAETDQDWEELREDFPEWADAMDKRLASAKTDILKEMPKADQFSQMVKAETDKLSKAFEKRLVKVKYPDYETTAKSPEFWAWLNTQGSDVQQLASSPYAEDAIKLLSAYKAKDTAPPRKDNNKKRRLEQSVAPRGGTGQPVKSEADMSDEELRAKIASEIWE